MKAKCIPQETHKSYRFFLLMVVPLLLGALITLTSLANAEWNSLDARILNTPFNQGWLEGTGEPSQGKFISYS